MSRSWARAWSANDWSGSFGQRTAGTAGARLVHSAAAERLTEQELVARVRALAGDEPHRLGFRDH